MLRGHRGWWLTLAAVVAGSFAVLGYFGRQIYRTAPPVPDFVVTPGGGILMTGDDIRDGSKERR